MRRSIEKRENRKRKLFIFLKLIPFWLSLLAELTIIFDFGFQFSFKIKNDLPWFYLITLIIGILSILRRYFSKKERPPIKVRPFDVILLLLLIELIFNVFNSRELLHLGILFLFIREFSSVHINLKKTLLNPSQIFIASFIFIVLVGTMLLQLPNATHKGISFINALFTSTSAVCVTGLTVVDTGTYYTRFGQYILIILMQLGGLGIMTFTSYFSYFFSGISSFQNQFILKDMTNTEKIAEVFSVLKKILFLTFIVETIGAIIIFYNLNPTLIPALKDRLFFSVFHSVSGFCNAGFSTLHNSLYETGFRFNYPLHLVIAFLIIIGGIGYPILFNFSKYLKHFVVNRVRFFGKKSSAVHIPWILNINTRIVVITTFLLILFGTGAIYFLEYSNTLQEHSGFGKVVEAFFGAVTPRTAGFNSVNMSQYHLATVLIIMLLMWVGASPGSTGGGIKTSTFAIATLNIFSLARGKNRIELFRREVADISVRRAFAIIALSLIVIGISTLLISSFEQDKTLISIAFESFSAYSTVGLSLGITANLSDPSKLVLIATMFVGRVGMLTLLIALMPTVKHQKYRYSTEEILIN